MNKPSTLDILHRIKPKIDAALPAQPEPFVQHVGERAFVNMPFREVSFLQRPVMGQEPQGLGDAGEERLRYYTEFEGRLVSSGTNLNGATWTDEDLQFGLSSVAGGPLNYLHEARTVVGCLMEAEQDALTSGETFIKVRGVVWNWLYPGVVGELQENYSRDSAWLSMECVSKSVQCISCGTSVAYHAARNPALACDHILNRSAPVRFAAPTFLGAALIFPPESPGWPGATVDYVSLQVAKLVDDSAVLARKEKEGDE